MKRIYSDTINHNGQTNVFIKSEDKYILHIANEIPDCFYKDVGGKHKSIDLHVELLDQEGNRVQNMKVPLSITLYFFCNTNTSTKYHQAEDQSLLNIFEDPPYYIDHQGKCLLHFRIDDVSRNHTNRKFCLSIAIDESLCKNIKADSIFTEGILVKSKEPKREKDMKTPSSKSSKTPTAEILASAKFFPDIRADEMLDVLEKWVIFLEEKLGNMAWRLIGRDKVNPEILYYSPVDPNLFIAQVTSGYENDVVQLLPKLMERINREADEFELIRTSLEDIMIKLKYLEWHRRPVDDTTYLMVNPNEIISNLQSMINKDVKSVLAAVKNRLNGDLTDSVLSFFGKSDFTHNTISASIPSFS